MTRFPFIFVLALTCAFLFGSCSATQRISDAATAVRQDLDPLPPLLEDTRDILWKNRQVLPYKDFKQAITNLNTAKDKVASALSKIDVIQSQVPKVEDREQWFGRNLKLIAGIAIPSVIFVILWRTGLLAFIRGWLGLITPQKRASAQLSAEAIITDAATPVQREAIAASRTDPAFDAAFRKAKRKLKT